MLIIRTLLPQYLESIPVMIILGFGYLIYLSRTFLTNYLTVTNQLRKWMAILLLGVGVNAGLDIILISRGYGIQGVAFACSFSFLLIAFSIRAENRPNFAAPSIAKYCGVYPKSPLPSQKTHSIS